MRLPGDPRQEPADPGLRPERLPAGLAGWILEKFWAWTDHDGDLFDAVGQQAILDNLTTYWVTGTIGSSTRIYYETMKTGRFATHDAKVEVPTAVAQFPAEITKPPRSWVEAATTSSAIPATTGAGTLPPSKNPTC